MILPVEEFFKIPFKTKFAEAEQSLMNEIVESWKAKIGRNELEFIQTLESAGDYAGLCTYVFDKGRFVAGIMRTKEVFNRLNSKVLRDLIGKYFKGVKPDHLKKISIEDENFNQVKIDSERKLNIIYYNSIARDSIWIDELGKYLKLY